LQLCVADFEHSTIFEGMGRGEAGRALRGYSGNAHADCAKPKRKVVAVVAKSVSLTVIKT